MGVWQWIVLVHICLLLLEYCGLRQPLSEQRQRQQQQKISNTRYMAKRPTLARAAAAGAYFSRIRIVYAIV